MKVVILCGGKGVRYTNQYNELPKALATIGNVPIIWHLFKYFSHFGYNDFILCTGYKGSEIKNYIETIEQRNWNIECVDTGIESQTGERIRQILPLTENKSFLVTYADGLSSIDLHKLVSFHERRAQTATISVVKPQLQYGVAKIDEDNKIVSFSEKPMVSFYINGGFMIFNNSISDFLNKDDILEVDTFSRLTKASDISAFTHNGFWKSMDTFKENIELDKMWKLGNAPWKVW